MGRFRYGTVVACAICLFVCLTAGCSVSGEQGRSKQIAIAVITKASPYDYWKTARSGAQAAAEEFGAKLIYYTTAEFGDALVQQKEYMNDAIAGRVDGILLAPEDFAGLADEVKAAYGKRIPVVTIDARVDSALPVSHVASDNVHSASLAASFMLNSGASGKVLIVRGSSVSSTEYARITGFETGLSAIGPGSGLTLSDTLPVPPSNLMAMQTAKAYLDEHKDISGILATCSECAAGAALALRDLGLAERVVCIGFDSSQDEIRMLEEGFLRAIIVQNPFAMGYFGVKAVADKLGGVKVNPLIETKAEIVTKDMIKQPEYQKLIYPFDK